MLLGPLKWMPSVVCFTSKLAGEEEGDGSAVHKNLLCWSVPVLVASRRFTLSELSCIQEPMSTTPHSPD